MNNTADRNAPKVFICILNWNGIQNTRSCIESILLQDYGNFRILVIDNGSSDGSLEVLRGLGDRIDLIENDENLGFTGGCNVGFRHALSQGARYVWLLNNDSDCKPNTLRVLINYCEDRSEVGMASPIIINRNNGRNAFALRRLDLKTGLDVMAVHPEEAEEIQEKYPFEIMIRGTALLIKRTLIESIGVFDENFFAYCEDDDYCVRCSRAGFQAACVTTAYVYHDEGRPGKGWRPPYGYYYSARNGIRFWRKHASGLSSWKHARWHVCMMFRVLARSGYGKPETDALADGIWSGLVGGVGRWDPESPRHRMPRPLRMLFGINPAFTLAVLEADPKAAFSAFLRRPGPT